MLSSAIWGVIPKALKPSVRRLRYRRQIKTGRFRSTESEFSLLDSFVSPGDFVLDIGANVGHYTLELAKLVGPTGRVIAFEPLPETFAMLAHNVVAAKHRNVTLINAAVGAACELVGFTVPNGNAYEAHIDQASADKVMTVPASALQYPRRVSFIKIDAEGFEPTIIEALSPIIERDRPRLMVEHNSKFLLHWSERERYRFNDVPKSHNHILEPA